MEIFRIKRIFNSVGNPDFLNDSDAFQMLDDFIFRGEYCLLEAKNDGPWVDENEHRTLEEQNDQLVSGFFFNKMFYERPDLFEELENGKDIEELLFQMIDEELNDDVFDTDLLN